jgi:hypothetical protein
MKHKTKMMGITLMIVGIVSLGAGIYLYSKPVAEIKSLNLAEKISNTNLVAETKSTSLTEEATDTNHQLEKLIEIAIADGVLTNNERKLIEKTAIELGANDEEIIEAAEARLAASTEKSETAIIDQYKKSGDDFEKFIVQKFDKKYFKVKEWAGDKYIKGIYAETTQQPDLIMDFELGDQSATFAVECKWRKRVFDDGLNVATKEQLERYRAYGAKKNMPVFMAIGLGGEADAPEQLFIVPIQKIANEYVPISTLARYEHDNKKNFYFDMKARQLR